MSVDQSSITWRLQSCLAQCFKARRTAKVSAICCEDDCSHVSSKPSILESRCEILVVGSDNAVVDQQSCPCSQGEASDTMVAFRYLPTSSLRRLVGLMSANCRYVVLTANKPSLLLWSLRPCLRSLYLPDASHRSGARAGPCKRRPPPIVQRARSAARCLS